MATLAELVKKRREKGASVGGALSFGIKERLKEKFDPRQFFNQSGLLTALFPQLRSYKSKDVSADSSVSNKKLTALSSSSSLSQPILEAIQKSNSIAARNSMVLPAMHRDINVMRQNMIKLVKLKGGTPTNKADAWFMKSQTMESAYENRFKKSSSPVKEEPVKEEKEETKGILGMIGDAVGKGIETITTITDKIVSNLPVVGAAAGAGLGLASRAAGLLMTPAGLTAAAVGIGVVAALPDDVKKSDPLESGDYKLDKPFKEKSWMERALIGKRKTAIQEYIDTAIEMKLGPVFTNKQAKDIVDYWDIEVPPELIAKEGQKLNKATGVVPEDKKVKAKTFEDLKQSAESTFMNRSEQIGASQPSPVSEGQPNPRAAVESLKKVFGGSEQVEAKDPFAYKGPTIDRDVDKKIEAFVENNKRARLEASPETQKNMMNDTEARMKAEQIYGVQKNVGAKIDTASQQVKEVQREEASRPVVKMHQQTNNSTVPTSQSSPNISVASVYDSEMLSLFGMSKD